MARPLHLYRSKGPPHIRIQEVIMDTSKEVFRKILVPTDFTPAADAALEQAADLARRNNAEITVAHVVKEVYTTLQVMAYAPTWGPMSGELADGEQAAVERAHEGLRALVSPYEASGARIRRQVLVGAPFVEIIHAVQRDGYDLVVAGTRGQGAVKRALVGSTATKLARKCPCPVWIARPRNARNLNSLLVPLDFSDVSGKILELAASLAVSTGATLHLLHVFDTSDLHGVPLLPEVTKAEFSRYRRQVRRAALDQLQRLSESLTVKPSQTTLNVSPGIPWQVVRTIARRVDADVVVMGSVGRGGIPGLLIGNTAEKVLHNGEVPLLIVKPDGFVSPVPPPEQVASEQPAFQARQPVAT
jgi:universal stress protein E